MSSNGIRDYDEPLIRRCIELSIESTKKGENPFGSLIAKNGEIIVESSNSAKDKVPLHAEIMAMMSAQDKLGTNSLVGYDLYTSCEPCPMCSFMIREYKLSRVLFSARSAHMGGFSRWDILQDKGLERFPPYFSTPPEIIGGLLEEEGAKVLHDAGLWMFGKT